MDYNFNRVAGKYDESRGLPEGVPEQICRWVLSRLPADPSVTEIGVGTARIALPFIEQNIRYTGLDISEQMLTLAREKLGGDLHRSQLLLADITEPLPLPDHSQDAVVAVHILHLVDPNRTLSQVRRILKENGALIWGYQFHDDLSPKKRIRSKFYEVAAALGHKAQRDFNVPEARRLLAEWGAQVSHHVVATWSQPHACEAVLDELRGRVISSTWAVEEHIFQEAMRQTEAWTRAEYGDPTRMHENEERFMVDWYQL